MCLQDIDIAILCGGKASRLGFPSTPKVLTQINGVPFLEYLLRTLKQHGARRIFLLTGHGADSIAAHISYRKPDGLEFDLEFDCSVSGVTNALIYARPRLRSPVVMVTNGDTLIDADLCRYVNAAKQRVISTLYLPGEGGMFEDSGFRLLSQAALDMFLKYKGYEEMVDRVALKIPLPGRYLDIGTPERLKLAGDFVRDHFKDAVPD